MNIVIFMCTRYHLLIAGSRGWNNYRHQADVMAMSKLLHTDPENVVMTMISNDVVNHRYNPYPGQLFNTLKHTPEYNVYNKDYINSTKITLGSMKELMSHYNFTRNDIVMIYYNDHGAPGLLCSPKNRDTDNSEFFADDVEEYLKELSQQVGKILFIIESCYSGSVGKYISIPNVFTISAANSIQSSYASKYSNELSTFVTNLFTLNLINYINDPSNRDSTILDLVNYLAKYTLRSTVVAYGDNHFSSSITKYKLQDIFGILTPIPRDDEYEHNDKIININTDSISTNRIKLARLLNKYQATGLWDIYINYYEEAKEQLKYQRLFDYILSNISSSLQLLGVLDFKDVPTMFKVQHAYKSNLFNMVDTTFKDVSNSVYDLDNEIIVQDYKCYKEAITTYKRYCSSLDEYEFDQLLPLIAKICNKYGDNYNILKLNIRRTCQTTL